MSKCVGNKITRCRIVGQHVCPIFRNKHRDGIVKHVLNSLTSTTRTEHSASFMKRKMSVSRTRAAGTAYTVEDIGPSSPFKGDAQYSRSLSKVQSGAPASGRAFDSPTTAPVADPQSGHRR